MRSLSSGCKSDRRLSLILSLLLAVATAAAYWPAWAGVWRAEWGSGFINYDDGTYVAQNEHVQEGLGYESAIWAFTSTTASNWHPLTWLSLELDTQLFGTAPWGYHLTNVLLHIADSVLLFLVFRRMTGAIWPSALVAGLFALHPLHVESVAWVAERKDVLSVFFGLLALWAYTLFSERQNAWVILALVVSFGLSLLAKPMLVTFPFLLFLLDYWPLGREARSEKREARNEKREARSEKRDGRAPSVGEGCGEKREVSGEKLGRRRARRLFEVKIPLFVLAACSCAITSAAQVEALSPFERIPLGSRIANAVVAYVAYLRKMVWPVDLAIFYPHLGTGVAAPAVFVALGILAGITAAAWWTARRRPYFIVGWLWYLGTLVPVIGLVQVGGQALADRYTYFPMIGVSVALSWGLADMARAWGIPRIIVGLAGVVLLSACGVATWRQAGYWHNDVTLWEHAARVVPNSTLVLKKLGMDYLQSDELKRASDCYERAIKLRPDDPEGYNGLGHTLSLQGRWEEAIGLFEKALEVDPNDAVAHTNLGRAMLFRGSPEQAIRHFSEVARLRAESPGMHDSLGQAYSLAGQWEKAQAEFKEAIAIEPRVAKYYFGLAHAQKALGQRTASEASFNSGLRMGPEWPEAANEESWTLATSPDEWARAGQLALYYAQEICEATEGNNADFLDTLAAALAENGRFDEAAATAERALALVPAGHPAWIKPIRDRLGLYRARKTFRDDAGRKRKWG